MLRGIVISSRADNVVWPIAEFVVWPGEDTRDGPGQCNPITFGDHVMGFLWIAAGRVEFIHDAVIPLVPTLVEVPPNRVLVGFKHLLLRPILRMG